MNYFYSLSLACLTLSAFTTISAHAYLTVEQRQQALIIRYNDILEKWSPAILDLSEKSLRTTIKNIQISLGKKITASSNSSDDAALIAILKDIKAQPFQYLSMELDHDIKTIVSLYNEAYVLDLQIYMDIEPLQKLQKDIEQLPCFQQELANEASFVKMYPIYLIGCLGALAFLHLNYPTLSPLP